MMTASVQTLKLLVIACKMKTCLCKKRVVHKEDMFLTLGLYNKMIKKCLQIMFLVIAEITITI